MLHGCSPHAWYNSTSTHSNYVQHKGIAMSSPNLAPFVGQRYLNLESVKRDGTPVQTPVWFAEEQGVLYVYTLANAGKVKRIRRHPRIRIAPCTMRGTVTGPWVEADSHHRGCYDRSPWACVTTAQIWLDEGARRPLQSSDAPGTGRHRHTGARVTMGADHGERPWWKRAVSQRRSPASQQHGTTAGVTRGPCEHRESPPPVCLAGRRASAGVPLDLPALF